MSSPFAPPSSFNIADYFLDARMREGRGHRTALILDDRQVTYLGVQRAANRFARALRRCGAKQEERIMLALPDGEDFVAALFGCLKLGAVAVMVNPASSTDEVESLLAYSRARVLVTTASSSTFLAVSSTVASTAASLEAVLVIGESPAAELSSPEQVLLDDLIVDDDPFGNVETHRDDPAIWLFSGGTTGRPKAVVQTHSSFANTTELYAKSALKYTEDDITIAVPKLYFGYATGSGLLFPFAVGGATVLFPEHPTAELILEKIARHRATILVNVPTMIQKMLTSPQAATAELDSLRFATSAGEALPEPLYRRWKDRFGVELLDGLGTAEMWHIFITNTPDAVRPGTLGRVVPGFELRVRDRNEQDVADGEVGQLWVKGDSRAIGYWQDMNKTRKAFRGDWFVAGDMVSRDADGFVTYCGRQDDALKVGGKWLLPAELESCLAEHPAVRECAVVGIEMEGLIKPVAFVTATEDSFLSTTDFEDALKDWALARLQPYKHPRSVVVLDEFPRTHLGKIARGKLKSMT